MLVIAAGDCHGRLSALYDGVLALEGATAKVAELVVQVGDFGVWPDHERLDRATRKRKQPGEFAAWMKSGRAARRPTIFVAGNHEDFAYLQNGGTRDLLPGLTFLAWGEVTTHTSGAETLRIGGVGGCFGPSDYEKPALSGNRRRHYLRHELQRLQAQRSPRLDFLLLHDAPAGRIEVIGARPGWGRPATSQSEGLADLIAATAPRLCLTGHFHRRSARRIGGVLTLGLEAIPYPGSLLLLDVPPADSEPQVIAEYGPDATVAPPPGPPPPLPGEEGSPEQMQLLDDMEQELHAWAERVCRGHKPHDRRQELHAQWLDHPCLSLLLDALRKNPLRPSLIAQISPEEREEVLEEWRRGELPWSDRALPEVPAPVPPP